MASASKKGWANFVLNPISQIDPGWLKPMLGSLWPVREKILASSAARRLLNRKLANHEKPESPRPDSLRPAQQWLLEDIQTQRDLARTLGSMACTQQMKRIIDRKGIDQIHAQIGPEEHRRILEQPGLDVEGICGDVFLTHLKNDLSNFFSCVGVSLLSQTIPEDDDFSQTRMRFAFSPKSWHSRIQGLVVDSKALEQAILNLTKREH